MIEGVPVSIHRHRGAGEVHSIEARRGVEILEPPAQHLWTHATHRFVADTGTQVAARKQLQGLVSGVQGLHRTEEADLGASVDFCGHSLPVAAT